MVALLLRFARDEAGASAVEYGILAAMISCFMISSVRTIGAKMTSKFAIIGNALN